MKKTISLLLLLSVIFMPVKAQDVVYQPRQTEIEHRPVSLRNSPHAFFECPDRRLGSYDFLLHDRTTQPYRLRFHLPGERR